MNTYTITTAAEKVHKTPQYIRHAISSGALVSTLKPIEGRKSGVRHEIKEADLEAWRNGIGAGHGRADGRTKFVVYLNEKELAKVQKAIPDVEVKRAYDPAKQAARKAAKAAKTAA
jgi:hypothetical protein